MKKLTVVFHLESGMERRALMLIQKYRKYTSFNQSQAIIQLILRNEDYINVLCPEDQLEEMGRLEGVGKEGHTDGDAGDDLDFIKRYEEDDRVDIFGEQGRMDDISE
jgi:hypothetical protein